MTFAPWSTGFDWFFFGVIFNSNSKHLNIAVLCDVSHMCARSILQQFTIDSCWHFSLALGLFYITLLRWNLFCVRLCNVIVLPFLIFFAINFIAFFPDKNLQQLPMNSFSPFYVSHFQSMSLCSQPLIPPTLSIGHHTQAELQSSSTLQQEIWWTHTFTRHILHKIHHTKTRDGHHGMDWIRYNDLPEQKLYCKTLSKAQLTLALSTF